MGFTARKFYTIFLLSLAVLFFFTWEVQGNLCQRRSVTWSGPCLENESCKHQCINMEDSTSGACHPKGSSIAACFCSFNCLEN
ncbi:putative knottin, scorpion toxin [Medicago truncatula]|uniref:Defensin-like protein n=1 Tax=Medicago truncatula TaxID=3880 RepID=A0A072TMS9_MEDTR|nr:Defensin-like protein [Medicago truncatula]RHN39051.1 putative knottin, scorpion toxin [Medicago truncatula]